MCNRKHQNGSISHLWKLHHIEGKSDGNRFEGLFFNTLERVETPINCIQGYDAWKSAFQVSFPCFFLFKKLSHFFYLSFFTINCTDNVDDDVERNLRKEREIILGSLTVLEKLHADTVEQIRKLRATIYLLDRDLENKESSLQIDQQNLVLRENQIDMKIYEGNMNLDP